MEEYTRYKWLDVPDENNLPKVPDGQPSLAKFDAFNMNRIETGIEQSFKKSEDSTKQILKIIEDLIYYLNNESPSTLHREDDGSLIHERIDIFDSNLYVYKPSFSNNANCNVDIQKERVVSFNFEKPHKYKSPDELLTVDIRFNDETECKFSKNSSDNSVWLEIETNNGVTTLYPEITIYQGWLIAKFNLSNIQDCACHLSFNFKNVSFSTSSTTSTANSRRQMYISNTSRYEYYSRDIIEFNL